NKYFFHRFARDQQSENFQIQAIGTGGHFSPRSSIITIMSDQFSISINGNNFPASQISTTLKYTNQTAVNIHCIAPTETDSLWISNDSTQLLRSGRAFTADINWILPPGDRLKRVYARFKIPASQAYTITSDSIILDTQAQILNISENSAGRSLTTADTLHLQMETIDQFGTAQVLIGNWQILLYNDGTHGDLVANDNIFEAKIAIPPTVQENQAPLSGRFVDYAGNETQVTIPNKLITINRAPFPVQLFPISNLDSDIITLRWTENVESDFAYYQVFHSNQSEMYEGLSADTLISKRNQTKYYVRGLARNQDYYFRIRVTNSSGHSSWSNEIMIRLKPENSAPHTILLAQPQIMNTDSVSLTWSQNWDDDFAAYYIYRSEQPISLLPVTPIAIKNQREQTTLIDFNLQQNQIYYYRVAVFNRSNQYTFSNQVSIRFQP
ncbi:fibronectin type III domain-containing protein, partial [candidate division KSB1 bacterium]|nr:fibronectin type III domain-containing protein [candidate division KSB1 bacterium]